MTLFKYRQEITHMINTADIIFTKSEYTLEDFAAFKLCPMLYFNMITDPSKSFCSKEQLRLSYEGEILSDMFSEHVEFNLSKEKIYYKNTSHCLVELTSDIPARCSEKFKSSGVFDISDIEEASGNIYNKAAEIVDDIHRWIKGSRYTIIGGVKKDYLLDGFIFTYKSDFRSVDYDKKKCRTIYINQYSTFPVSSAGQKYRALAHYKDIMAILNGNDYLADRVYLAMKIIKKINIQLESKRFVKDGIERITSLADEIKNYDFSSPCKKESQYCRFCRYFDKCF